MGNKMMALHMACLGSVVDRYGAQDGDVHNTEAWTEANAVLRAWLTGDASREQASQYFKANT